MSAAVNALLGPVTAPAPARSGPSAGAAGEADPGGSGFADALDLARTPAKAPPAIAAKAAAKAPAKPAATNDAQTDAAAPKDAEAARAPEAEPELEALAPADEAPVADDANEPDLSLLLPGWPEAATLRPPAAVALAPADSQPVAAGPDGLTGASRRERAQPPSAAIELPSASASASAPALAPTSAAIEPPSASASAPAPATSSEMAAPALPRPAAASADALSAAPGKPAAVNDLAAAPPLSALPAAFTQAAALAAPARQGPPTPTFEAHVAAALDSPAFAPALATQVSWLVRDGVQQARLSLNPAEMGPVTVRIVLDGTQARVDFSADMVATRAAIETSLPTLAAALHDRGLTLAGGGVSDGQPRSGAQGDRGQQAPGHRGAGDSRPQGPASEGRSGTSMRVERGLVDLIA